MNAIQAALAAQRPAPLPDLKILFDTPIRVTSISVGGVPIFQSDFAGPLDLGAHLTAAQRQVVERMRVLPPITVTW